MRERVKAVRQWNRHSLLLHHLIHFRKNAEEKKKDRKTAALIVFTNYIIYNDFFLFFNYFW